MKMRKRHKVATSCNRCRQNKRKCDSGVPCSNCKKNNVDCSYTYAQFSRTFWGDSPLSQEKIAGVAARRPRPPGVSGGLALPIYYGHGPSSISANQFNQNRMQQVLLSQSKQLSKALRVAHPSPRESSDTHNTTQHQATESVQSKVGLTEAEAGQSSDMTRIVGSVANDQQEQANWILDSYQPALLDNGIHPLAFPVTTTRTLPWSQAQELTIPNRTYTHPQQQQEQQQDFQLHFQRRDSDYIPLMSPMPGQGTNLGQPSDYGSSYEKVHHRMLPSGLSIDPLQTIDPSTPASSVTGLHPGVYSPLESSDTLTAVYSPLRSSDTITGVYSPLGSSDTITGVYSPLESSDRLTIGMNGFKAVYSGTNSQVYKDGRHSYPTQAHTSALPSLSDYIGAARGSVEQVRIEDHILESNRIQRIAKDILAIKKYDLCSRIPRHISQERDEFFVSDSSSNGTREIPSRLQHVPRDACFLVDVFFANAYYYYPVINRSTVELYMMESQTPQALFILNIVFMAACKHLGRPSDIKRAIQFRERAREVYHFVDSKARLSSMQGLLLGSLVVYGVFTVVIGLTAACGAHKASSSTPFHDEMSSLPSFPECQNDFPDLQAESQSIQDKKGSIPEAAYQARLWTFWGLYIRDSVSRLYFGWPHGLDSVAVTAELPRVRGCVGLAGKEDPSVSRMNDNTIPSVVIGKRRDTSFRRDDGDEIPQEKRQQLARAETRPASMLRAERVNYRSHSSSSDDDDDDDNDADGDNDSNEEDQDNHVGVNDPVNLHRNQRTRPPISQESDRLQKDQTFQGSNSVLSPKILEEQSRGSYVPPMRSRAMGTSDFSSSSSAKQQKHERHMERMKVLLAAEEDTTDGGSYARILFLEEIKLWTLGRRVALYLAGRESLSAPSVCPSPASMSSTSMGTAPRNDDLESFGLGDNSSHSGAYNQRSGQWSEQAWIQDYELQSLQADLIAWEKALPDNLRFQHDVDQEGLNHKVNGKMGMEPIELLIQNRLLVSSYYTITIMLQSSYLPIQQSTLSRNPPSAKLVDQDSVSGAEEVVSPSAYDPLFMSYGGPTTIHSQHQEKENGRTEQVDRVYFNTAHKICTELTNVLLHHVELMLDFYPQWCSIQAKMNHVLTAALRVSCLNVKLTSNSTTIREEAKAEFKMGSELFKRLATLPSPLTIRDWPVEEDVQMMLGIEEEFREMMLTQEEQGDALRAEAEQIMTSEMENAMTSSVAGVHMDNGTGTSQGPHHSSMGTSRGFVSQQHVFGFGLDEYRFSFDS
ncbi:hypothetical protein BGX31_003882 [Mortierella sp. GBA43]|nr:hypothetical protein BGX31_003882 [Mortierella sp. GBA43]